MDGSPFELWDRPADPTKVVLYFEGGGACFSAETCAFDNSTATVDLDLGSPPAGRGGLFDQTNPENPLADYSMVYVPYCTGDVHIGNKTTEYSPDLTVHHNGYVNATAGLDYLVANYPDVEELVVTGGSAGAVPTPLFGALAAAVLNALTTFGDSAARTRSGGERLDRRRPVGHRHDRSGPGSRPSPRTAQHPQAVRWRWLSRHHVLRFDAAYDGVQAFFGSIAGFEADQLVT
jgi:hypothetical protein